MEAFMSPAKQQKNKASRESYITCSDPFSLLAEYADENNRLRAELQRVQTKKDQDVLP